MMELLNWKSFWISKWKNFPAAACLYVAVWTACALANDDSGIYKNISHQSIVVELHGGISSLGEYYCEVGIGDPPQIARLQVDTGSSSVLVSSSGCKGCAFHNNDSVGVYDRIKSLSVEGVPCNSSLCGANSCLSMICEIQDCSTDLNACCAPDSNDFCGFSIRYGGDTNYHVLAKGEVLQETISFGNRSIEDVFVYNSVFEEGPWSSGVDGILGLGFPALNCNPNCFTPVHDQIFRAIGGPQIFSMCLGDKRGVLVLGSDGKKENIHASRVEYLPIISYKMRETYFTIGFSGISVGRANLIESKGQPFLAILDSGTTLLLLEDQLWHVFKSFLQGQYCHLPGVCSPRNIFDPGVCLDEKPTGFPSLSFHLIKNIRLQVPPSLYFIAYEDNTLNETLYCLGIQSAGLEHTVFGDALLRGFAMVFDPENSRVGFSIPNRTTCGAVLAFDAFASSSYPEVIHSVTGTMQGFALFIGVLVISIAGIAQLLLCTIVTREINAGILAEGNRRKKHYSGVQM